MAELYCICKKAYEDGDFMIECGKCTGWFHGSCVGIEEYQAQEIDIYVCPKCQPEHGPLVYSFLDVRCENGELLAGNEVKKRRNVPRHNYKEIHEGTKQITAGTVMFVRQLKVRKFFEPTDEVLTVMEDGTDMTPEYFHNNGFDRPIIIKDKKGLGIKIPPSNFTIYDVEKRVGSMFELHVIDVARQEDLRMKMREWTEYYNSPVRGKVLNVISLECSKTSLSDLVKPPDIVQNISWVDNAWPKDKNEESPHTRPVVSKYCLMSVKDCYTDFHVDFGGTSVWYHVVRGEKVFYFVKPTKENLEKYSQWVSSSDQGQVFFGEKVDKCYKVCLTQGDTLLLPSGWIHAVLTPKDSLVFGGNYLHSYSIPLQLKIYDMEKSLHTPLKFLFPNFETTNWFAARSILKKVKEIHQAGYQLPPSLFQGIEALLVSFRKWTSKKDEYAKYHKLQIPLELNPQKLMKSLEKELKYDTKFTKPFSTDHMASPGIYNTSLNKNVIRLKFNRSSTRNGGAADDSSSGTSSPEKAEQAKSLERLRIRREKSKKRDKKNKDVESDGSKGTEGGSDGKQRSLPSIRLNLNSDGSVVKKEEVDSDDDDDGRNDIDVTTSERTVSGIKLKLSISQPPMKTESTSSSTISIMQDERPPHPVAREYKKPVNLREEIEAVKNDIFSPSSTDTHNLYFNKKEESDEDYTVRPVSFNPDQDYPVRPKLDGTSESSQDEGGVHAAEDNDVDDVMDDDDEGDEDNGGYVVDFLPKPKIKPEGRQKRNKSESDSDYDPSDGDGGEGGAGGGEEDNYYEDADFVYPRIDVDSELIGDDFSWNPSQRKAPKRKPKRRRSSSKLKSTDEDLDPFFAPDEEIRPPAPKTGPRKTTGTSSDPSQSASQSRGGLGISKPPIKKKVKTSTAKQRLGRILKLDKTGTRYMR